MNGIEKITARILSESQCAVDAVKQEAAARCAEIAAAGDAAAKEEYWKLLKKGTEDAEKRGERLDSVAQLEAKKQILGAKQQLISEVFELAAEKLIAMPEEENVAFLAALAVRASRTGAEEVIFTAETRDKIGAQVVEKANSIISASGKKAELKLSGESREMRGGLILRDGSIEMNCSLDALIDGVKNDVTGQVAEILFE